ncbi:MAG: Sulfur metabolism protein SseC [uncultured Nocardioidaceae bacterium]|uniref:Sulfur metabolism protein SseC n=1 Tax=uncultured Nocardioidaceae bacterium TaxID=253824 RepID=A0A6J4NZ00_9ACTN|nr:MAG: Sulfur metabolism protein SseC [uncultured Nocardioidaceae bacterium]
MSNGCGAPEQGTTLADTVIAKEAVVQGRVLKDGQPASPAYVRLLDRSGEFTAEVPTSAAGEFRFFAGPGEWTVRALVPGAPSADRQVSAQVGSVAEVDIQIG